MPGQLFSGVDKLVEMPALGTEITRENRGVPAGIGSNDPGPAQPEIDTAVAAAAIESDHDVLHGRGLLSE